MRTDDFDYDLPADRIAQHARTPRDHARLLVLDRQTGAREHTRFDEIGRFLQAGDLVVLNDTRVIPARLYGVRAETGGRAECLLVKELEPGRWEALIGTRGKPQVGERLRLAEGTLEAALEEKQGRGAWVVSFTPKDAVFRAMADHGRMPLPPYIQRKNAPPAVHRNDQKNYQTVFARWAGAVAAPTAGLHFTEALLEQLEAQGVRLARVTLHVGPGTFRPVEVEDPREHPMHAERYRMPEETRAAIEETRTGGGRVICCGTTAIRTIETVAETEVLEGETRLFILPPYEPRWADGIITNFHLPRSTLLMLVAALAGREQTLAAYRDAVERGYRFYSYGDAMLVV